MLVTSLLPLLFVPFATASPLVSSIEVRGKNPGDPAGEKKVLADLKAITADIKTLNATLNTFEPNSLTGLQTAEKIMAETTTIEDAIKTTISDVNASSDYNEKQSGTIGITTLGLKPLIQSLIKNTIAHKPAFESVDVILDVSKSVEKSLETQRSLTEQLGTALHAKLTKDYASLEPATTKQIVGYFNKAIKAFASCSGIICVPGAVGKE